MNSSPSPFRFPRDPVLSFHFLRARARRRNAQPAGIAHARDYIWARNALYHCLGPLGIDRGCSILVPSYICKAAVQPLISFGARVVFYDVTAAARADLADLESKIDSRTKAILVAHYFGFPQDVDGIRRIGNRHGALIIEDCAHVLHSRSGSKTLGSIGDASFFSWRKFLPVYDGATLFFNRQGLSAAQLPRKTEAWYFTAKVALNLIEASVFSRPRFAILKKVFKIAPYLRHSLLNRTVSSAGRSALDANNNSADFDETLLQLPMSRLSRLIFHYSDIIGIRNKRSENYRFLAAGLGTIRRVQLLIPELPDGVCPWVLPAIIREFPDAHLALRDRGVPVTNWSGVRPQELVEGSCNTAEMLYNNLMFIPVHQDLRRDDLNLIVKEMERLCSSGKARS